MTRVNQAAFGMLDASGPWTGRHYNEVFRADELSSLRGMLEEIGEDRGSGADRRRDRRLRQRHGSPLVGLRHVVARARDGQSAGLLMVLSTI